jgi:uncharacterized protein YjbJ (UPF0337 family)
MNKDQLKGKAENIKGRVKEAMGALTGNKQQQADGLIDRVEGAARDKVAQAKGDLARKLNKPAKR